MWVTELTSQWQLSPYLLASPSLINNKIYTVPSIELFSHSVVFDSLQPHELQHTKLSVLHSLPAVCSKLMSTESVMPSNHLILYHSLLLLPSIFPSIRVSSNEVVQWLGLCASSSVDVVQSPVRKLIFHVPLSMAKTRKLT